MRQSNLTKLVPIENRRKWGKKQEKLSEARRREASRVRFVVLFSGSAWLHVLVNVLSSGFFFLLNDVQGHGRPFEGALLAKIKTGTIRREFRGDGAEREISTRAAPTNPRWRSANFFFHETRAVARSCLIVEDLF